MTKVLFVRHGEPDQLFAAKSGSFVPPDEPIETGVLQKDRKKEADAIRGAIDDIFDFAEQLFTFLITAKRNQDGLYADTVSWKLRKNFLCVLECAGIPFEKSKSETVLFLSKQCADGLLLLAENAAAFGTERAVLIMIASCFYFSRIAFDKNTDYLVKREPIS